VEQSLLFLIAMRKTVGKTGELNLSLLGNG